MKRTLPFIVFFLLSSPVSWGQPIERAGGILFSNIAPGELEDETIKEMPAKITFSSESGAPYGGVFVRIYNASGIAIFKNLCEKPWLFIKLPVGEYNVIAIDRKKVQRAAAFKVKKEGEGQTLVKLKWPKKVVGY